MNHTIKQEFFYQHAPQLVWEYITDAEKIASWLMPNNFKAEPGYEFTFQTTPMPNFGFDGTIYCKVLELIPFEKLVYSWKGGPSKGVVTLDTVVTWTLEAKDNGTLLSLEHRGFTEQQAFTFQIMTKGWQDNLAELNGLIKPAVQ
ncbi:SRPBCC domain-containing protein [Chitinophaga sp. Hz27]|uniref:SRPBCC family protein n=1 Tax=Chitinophaga sp. Hz27 TaxID=3347169 RepID=UPI0035D907A8